MSAIRGRQKSKTILTFCSKQTNRDQIKKSLNHVRISNMYQSKDLKEFTFIYNDIVVGMYRIQLLFNYDSIVNKRIKDCKNFKVNLFESSINGDKEINLYKDERFKDSCWNSLNKKNKLTVNELPEIILECSKLSELKMFL
jgi:hypothetical protein